jgi:inorganic triphosphatase YgiF
MEIELQYLYSTAPRLVIPTELADFDLEESRRATILDSFWDTEQLALRRAGSTLRIREQSGSSSAVLCWKGVATRRDDGAKQRQEVEIPLESIPDDDAQMQRILQEHRLVELIRADSGIEQLPRLRDIGSLRNRRSMHTYRQGLHVVELTWDRVTYPIGDGETRLEVETKSPQAARFLTGFDADLRALYAPHLSRAPHGKSRELCRRLYPDLLG